VVGIDDGPTDAGLTSEQRLCSARKSLGHERKQLRNPLVQLAHGRVASIPPP
jgi:hypothetical protein